MRQQLRLLTCLQLQVLVSTVTEVSHRDVKYSTPSTINIGLLQPVEGPLGFEMTGSAASMAVRDAQHRGYLNQTDVKYSTVYSVVEMCMGMGFPFPIEFP